MSENLLMARTKICVLLRENKISFNKLFLKGNGDRTQTLAETSWGFWWITLSQPELSLQCANLGEKEKICLPAFLSPLPVYVGSGAELRTFSTHILGAEASQCWVSTAAGWGLKAAAHCINMRWCFGSSFMDLPPKAAPSSSVASSHHPCPQSWQGEGVLTLHMAQEGTSQGQRWINLHRQLGPGWWCHRIVWIGRNL